MADFTNPISGAASGAAAGSTFGPMGSLIGHAVPASIKNAFYDVVTHQFNGQIDSKKAAAEMAAAAKN